MFKTNKTKEYVQSCGDKQTNQKQNKTQQTKPKKKKKKEKEKHHILGFLSASCIV
jgi:hypothetical protein